MNDSLMYFPIPFSNRLVVACKKRRRGDCIQRFKLFSIAILRDVAFGGQVDASCGGVNQDSLHSWFGKLRIVSLNGLTGVK